MTSADTINLANNVLLLCALRETEHVTSGTCYTENFTEDNYNAQLQALRVVLVLANISFCTRSVLIHAWWQ